MKKHSEPNYLIFIYISLLVIAGLIFGFKLLIALSDNIPDWVKFLFLK